MLSFATACPLMLRGSSCLELRALKTQVPYIKSLFFTTLFLCYFILFPPAVEKSPALLVGHA
jgi:hypothetical protein